MVSQKNLLRILINTFLGGVLIYIWSRFVNLGEISTALSGVKLEYLLILVVLFLISGVLRSLRLKILLHEPKLSFINLIYLNLLAQFLSFMIPIRAGEITKGVYLSRFMHRPFPTTIIWVFIDRFIDFYVVILLIVISLLFIPTNLPPSLITGCEVLLIGMSILAVVIIKNQKFSEKLTNFLIPLFIVNSLKIYFISFIKSILEGFSILDLSLIRWIKIMGVTLLAFIIDGMFWWVIFLALGLDLGILPGILGNALMALTFLIPAAPGYVGSAEASGLAVWTGILGLPTGISSSGTVLFHLVSVVILMVAGLVSLYLLKFDLNLVWRRFRK